MKCDRCGAEMGPSIPGTWRFDESGLDDVLLTNAPVRTCPSCGNQVVRVPNVDGLLGKIADLVARRPGPLRPAEIRFLRKHLGWSGKDLAQKMGVTPSTVSRWENGVEVMGATSERLLRLMAATMSPVDDYERHDRESLDDVLEAPDAESLRSPDSLRLEDGDWVACSFDGGTPI